MSVKKTKSDEGETVFQFVTCLRRCFTQWTLMAECERSFVALTHLLVREQFLRVCSTEMALLLRERVPQNTKAMTTLAEQYIEAHGGCITGRSVKTKELTIKPRSDSLLHKTEPSQPTKPQFSRSKRECFNCTAQERPHDDRMFIEEGSSDEATTDGSQYSA
uniref:SCAN box domain-containing protein n=1 Tax=Eptatretus burgeri TaxID=7764 RepID=A0A8C4Q2E8_EPTBU